MTCVGNIAKNIRKSIPMFSEKFSSNLNFARVKNEQNCVQKEIWKILCFSFIITKMPEMRYDIPLQLIVRSLSTCIARGIFLSDQCFIALAERVVPLGYRKCKPSVCRLHCYETIFDRCYVATLEHITKPQSFFEIYNLCFIDFYLNYA